MSPTLTDGARRPMGVDVDDTDARDDLDTPPATSPSSLSRLRGRMDGCRGRRLLDLRATGRRTPFGTRSPRRRPFTPRLRVATRTSSSDQPAMVLVEPGIIRAQHKKNSLDGSLRDWVFSGQFPGSGPIWITCPSEVPDAQDRSRGVFATRAKQSPTSSSVEL